MTRNYYEAGVGFRFKIEDDFPRLSVEQKRGIGEHWRQISKGKNMFPGGVWCAHQVEKNSGLEIKINRSDYAAYKWVRDNGFEIPGLYSMGTGVLVFDEDKGAFVFGVRSDTVAIDSGKISAFGGVIDWDNTQREMEEILDNDFIKVITQQTKKELGEELVAERMGEPMLIGAYVDEETVKVEFGFMVLAKGVRLAEGDDEHYSLIWVKPEELSKFVGKNRDRLEASTRGHLEYWADKMQTDKTKNEK